MACRLLDVLHHGLPPFVSNDIVISRKVPYASGCPEWLWVCRVTPCCKLHEGLECLECPILAASVLAWAAGVAHLGAAGKQKVGEQPRHCRCGGTSWLHHVVLAHHLVIACVFSMPRALGRCDTATWRELAYQRWAHRLRECQHASASFTLPNLNKNEIDVAPWSLCKFGVLSAQTMLTTFKFIISRGRCRKGERLALSNDFIIRLGCTCTSA